MSDSKSDTSSDNRRVQVAYLDRLPTMADVIAWVISVPTIFIGGGIVPLFGNRNSKVQNYVRLFRGETSSGDGFRHGAVLVVVYFRPHRGCYWINYHISYVDEQYSKSDSGYRRSQYSNGNI